MGKQVTEPLGGVKSGFVRVKKADQSQPRLGLPRRFPALLRGDAYRMVAAWLAELGVWTTRGSVERLVKGLPQYAGSQPRRWACGSIWCTAGYRAIGRRLI